MHENGNTTMNRNDLISDADLTMLVLKHGVAAKCVIECVVENSRDLFSCMCNTSRGAQHIIRQSITEHKKNWWFRHSYNHHTNVCHVLIYSADTHEVILKTNYVNESRYTPFIEKFSRNIE